MKKLISVISMRARLALASVILALAPVVSWAQTGLESANAETMMTKASSNIKSLGNTVATIMQYLIGIGGLISLVVIIINFIKGERDSMSKAAYWLLGCVIGFVFIALIKTAAFGS